MGLIGKAVEAFKEGLASAKKEQQSQQQQLAKTASAVNSLSGSFTELDSKLNLISRGFNTLQGSYSKLSGFFGSARQIEGITTAFNTLQTSVGQLGDQSLAKLRTATQGALTDLQLMKAANQAVLLGLPTEGFDELASSAIKLGRAMGMDAANAVESLTVGIGRGSKEVLDNLGVIVSAEEAYARFASQNKILGRELNDTEKKLAFQRLGMERIVEAAKNAGDQAASAATEFGKLDNVIKNLTAGFVGSVGSSVELGDAIRGLRQDAENAIPALAQLGGVVASIGTKFLEATDVTAGAINAVFVTPVRDAINSLSSGEVVPQDSKTAFLDSIFGTEEEVKQNLARKLGSAATQAKKETARIAEELGKLQASTVETVQSSIERLGIDKIPGFDDKYVATLKSEYVKLFSEFKSGAINADSLTKKLTKLTEKNAFSQEQFQGLQKVIGSAMSEVEKDFEAGARASEEFSREQEQITRELGNFQRAIEKLTGSGPLEELRVDISRIFSESISSGELTKNLTKIGETAQKLKVPLSDLSGIIKEFQTGEAILGPGNSKGLEQFQNELGKSLKNENFLGLSDNIAAALQQGGQLGADLINQALTDGIGRGDVAGIGGSLGSAIGAAFGNPQAGGIVGSIIGSIAAEFGKDGAGTKARKSADKFFADIFDANRLSIIVGDQVKQINDLVFSGTSAFGGSTDFASGTFNSFLSTLPAQSQAAFQGVGVAFEELLGVSDDISGQIGAVLANNIGGELNNLQFLVEATGKSFEELAEAIFTSNLSIEATQSALVALQDVMTIGIPGAVGAVDQAISNFQVALNDGRATRALFDSLRDIGAEAQELGQNDFPALANKIASSLGLAANQVAAFFQSMKLVGIGSISDLVNASNSQLLALAANVQQVTAGGTPTNTPAVNPTAGITPAGNFTQRSVSSSGGGGARGGGASANRAQDQAKQKLQQLREEVYRNVQASSDYKAVLAQLANGELSSFDAGKQLQQLYRSTFNTVKELNSVQEKYRKELEKSKPNANRLGDLARRIEELQKATGALKKETADVSFLKDLQSNMNLFGLAAESAGVKVEDVKKKLIDTFRAGKLSITDANGELKKVQDTFTGGIPGAIGDVGQAFGNLLKGGKNGGAFSIDAFKDIFVEAKELFNQNQSPLRKSTFATLTEQFNSARDALQNGIASGKSISQVRDLQDAFNGTKKALDDFSATAPAIGLEDFRSILGGFAGKDVADTFFQSIANSGINTFDGLAGASDDAIIGILASFEQLGGPLQETSAEINRLNEQLSILEKPRQIPIELIFSTNASGSIERTILEELKQRGIISDDTPSTAPGLPAGGNSGSSGSSGTGLNDRERTRLEYLRRQKNLTPARKKQLKQLQGRA